MLHFTPVQELGESRSAYSLYHQLQIANTIFSDQAQQLSEEEKEGTSSDFSRFLQLVEKLREVFEYGRLLGVLTLGDIVLNHTANNSPWLSKHPEATYNTDNCPYLKPAVELDLVQIALLLNLILARLFKDSLTIYWPENTFPVMDYRLSMTKTIYKRYGRF